MSYAIVIAENGNDHEVSVRVNGNGFVELWCNGTLRLPSLTPFEARRLSCQLLASAEIVETR